MSTKCSIAHGDGFHLYNDCLDEEHVFMRLDKTYFEATPDGVTVKLPLHVWEYLRSFPGADLSDACLSDKQILEEAIEAVDSRLARSTEASRDQPITLTELGTTLVMGDITLPRDQQIAMYVEHRRRQRTQQQAVLARVDALKSQ